jgi:hypothetical protein
MRSKGLLVRAANKKDENFDQIHADTLVNRSGVRITL